MTNEKSALVLNIATRISLVAFLSVLAVGLINGADPVTATIRSVIAFVSFLILGWGASVLLVTPETEEAEVEAEDGDTDTETPAEQNAPSPAVGTAMPVGAMSAPQE